MNGRSFLKLLGLASFAWGTAAHASDAEIFSSQASEIVNDAELDQQRGGFRWDGLDIAFGAELRAYISDVLVAQTNINLNDGAIDFQSLAINGVKPITASDLAAILAGSGLRPNLGTGSAYLTNDGKTAVIQRADLALQNIVVNSANNIEIRQELNAQLDITNFGPFQSGIISERMGNALGTMVGLSGMGN
jgi:hypothetical protein